MLGDEGGSISEQLSVIRLCSLITDTPTPQLTYSPKAAKTSLAWVVVLTLAST